MLAIQGSQLERSLIRALDMIALWCAYRAPIPASNHLYKEILKKYGPEEDKNE